MKAADNRKRILTLHIALDGLQKVIWRNVEVADDMPLNQLAYLIMVSFDTNANHLYVIYSGGEEYSEGNWDEFEGHNSRKTKLADLLLMRGDTLEMDYDMGAGHQFNIEVIGEDLVSGETDLPRIIDGKGCGIIEDITLTEMIHYIEQISTDGKTAKPIYCKDRTEPWDYRKFDVSVTNEYIKSEMAKLSKAYGRKA